MNKITLVLLLCVYGAVALINPSPIKLVAISTPFPSPVGIDYHAPTNTLIQSINYNTGGDPYNFERVDLDGNHHQFSSISGLTDEVKIATVRAGNPQFNVGDLFVGNGLSGQIMKISSDGTTVVNPWATLPSGGLIRGGLYVDQTGVWGYDLLACTDNGYAYRINAAGAVTLVGAYPGLHFEGIITVPDDALVWGPLAGRVLIGNENNRLLFTYSTAGDSSEVWYSVSAAIEDLDNSVKGENFFGNNFGTSRLVGASGSQFPVGAVIATQEFPDGGAAASGLYVLQWDFALNQPVTTPIPLTSDSYYPGQWEHTTFAPTGVKEVPPENDCDNKNDFFGAVPSLFNVFALNGFSASGSDSAGRVAAGGDITASNYQFASALTFACGTDPEDNGAVAGGSLSLTDGSINGNGVYGSSLTFVRASVGCANIQDAAAIDFSAAATILAARATQIQGLAATGTATYTDGWLLTLTCAGGDLEVFDTTGIDLASVHGYSLANCASNASIFINSPGASIVPGSGAFFGQFDSLKTHVLWNFHQATSINLWGVGLKGSILAPSATVSYSSGNVDGQVFVSAVNCGWNCPEFHNFPFEGCI